MLEEHENEKMIHTNLLEGLTQKYDNVKQFEAEEKKLKANLETYKNDLDNEKKQRINEVNEKEREKI